MRLAEFQGRWLITRQITDRLAGQAGAFEGAATLTPDGAGLLYAEAGMLRLGGQEMRAERRYLWRQDGARIAVLFEDGRPFHSFGAEARAASHWCDPDQYDVAYDFADWPRWSARWTVNGPRKDYTMLSRYAPDPSSSG